MKEKLKRTVSGQVDIGGLERGTYSSIWREAVSFKGSLVLCVTLAMIGLTGCGFFEERRILSESRKILSNPDRDVEDLNSVRPGLRRIIDMKLQAVNQLEVVDRVLGRKYLVAGSYNLAREALEEAEYLKPYSAFIKKDLGECYYFLGASALDQEERDKNFQKSRAYYNKALEIDPELIEARYGLSLVLYFGFDNVQGAIEQMKMVVEQDPRNVDARFALGRYYYELEEYSKALGEYIEITNILPKSSPRRAKAEENIMQINREM
jgi:cytochrome c-type biogenesis protein CcmH/NrfG